MDLTKLQQLAARAGLGRRALISVGVATALAPLLAVSAVAGLTGSDDPATDGAVSSDTSDTTTHTNETGCDDFLFVDDTKMAVAGGPADCEEGASGENRKNGVRSATSTPEPTGTTEATPTGEATATATATETTGASGPHNNGKGCDDVNEQKPGGPQGCEVGNSAGHRKNGANKATPTPSGTATGTRAADATATGTTTATATTEKKDPHDDGNGCDDVNERKPGGPQGCEVGNSGPNRKNGDNNSGTATATPVPGGTVAPASTPTTGGGNGNGNGNGQGQGNGKGKNK
jgi:hypothetical protein